MKNIIYNYIYGLFPYRWRPNLDISTVLEDANYQTAWYYLLVDAGLVFIALLWGAGFCGALMRQEKTLHTPVHLSTFAFISSGLGFALMIAEIFVLVLFQSLTHDVVISLFSITSVIACGALYLSRKDIYRNITLKSITGTIVAVFILFMLAVYQFSSAGSWAINDSTSYHLPYADFFLLNKGLSAIPEHLIYPYQTLNFNLLYSAALLFTRDLSQLQTIHALFATLTAFGVYSFCQSTGQRIFISIGATSLFISSIYAVHTNRFGANVDCGSMFFVLCSVFALSLWAKNRAQWLLIASAITLGIAIGTKYLMCIFALPIAITILITEKCNWKPLAIYVGWAAVWGLWWYIRNFIYTGNPVHPFASNIFGLYLWSESEITQHVQGALQGSIPKNIIVFLLMPFYAYKNYLLTWMGASLVITLLYVSTALSWLLNKKNNLLLLFCWIYLISWFLGAQEPRYMMPVIPLIVVYSGMITNAFFSRFLPGFVGKSVAAIAIIPAFAVGTIYVQQEFIKVSYSDIGASLEMKEKTILNNSIYDLMSHANTIFEKDVAVYEFFMRDGRWFYKGTLVGSPFGPHGYWRIIDSSAKGNLPGLSPEKLEQVLKEKYSAQGFIIPNPPYILYSQDEFDGYFNLMYRNHEGAIYKFKNHPQNEKH